MDFSQIKGFNYQPSYGRNGFELWRNFDADVINKELGRGKEHFPAMNGIRLWLSWDAFIYADEEGRERFCENFDTALAIAAGYGLPVMPVLYNRWHNWFLDYGGLYIDHFLPESWGGAWAGRRFAERCRTYVEAVVGPHADDPRVMAWDLCNEPFSYNDMSRAPAQRLFKAEYHWLASQYELCKELGATAPITVGAHWGTPIEQQEPISDVLSIHPYWTYGADKDKYEAHLDADIAFARKVGKPLIATETCWGSFDDQKRVEIIEYTLTQLSERDIGWLAYLLHHSLIADAHRPEYGPVGPPGNLAFIEADGSLRPGHDVFNQF
jgi:endo-1,4-beta-mannosidase